jgi:hypothetical protein
VTPAPVLDGNPQPVDKSGRKSEKKDREVKRSDGLKPFAGWRGQATRWRVCAGGEGTAINL